MVDSHNLDIGIHMQYARRINLIESIDKEYHIKEASSIPAQIRIIDFYPKPSEMDSLLGVGQIKNPWAFFFPPPKFRFQRRSPFGFFRVAPSLGSFAEEEESEQDLDDTECENEEEEKEKAALKNCFNQIKKINSWLSFIVGRVGQFLQG
jgi:Family of unknown function (DUF5399)